LSDDPTEAPRLIPVARPVLLGNEQMYVADCVRSSWISSRGDYLGRFAEAFRLFIGVEHALPVSSGTTALHLALEGLGVGSGDEVIVPDLTFGACANAVIQCGARPVFADIDRLTWTLDPTEAGAKITNKTKAIMAVHLYGHPCAMGDLESLADRHGLAVLEDCAEAIGAEYEGRRVGGIGRAGCFSFFANKVVTTGEGGMITTNDSDLFRRMGMLRDHGMAPEKRYWHMEPGFNYRLTNLQAAIGLAQMECVDDFLAERERLVALYRLRLGKVAGLSLPPDEPWAKNVHWLFTVLVDASAFGMDRDTLCSKLRERGVDSRTAFYPLHEQPAFRPYADCPCPVSVQVSTQGVSLPTGGITMEEGARVCESIEAIKAETSP
jgi:perosamine synthetase